MDSSWMSVVPPLLVIGVVCITQKLNVSLGVGILIAALIASRGDIGMALTLLWDKLVVHLTDLDNIYLYLLLTVISSLIVLLNVTGVVVGCARIISEKIKTKRTAELSAVGLSCLLGIDDYLSILTVGFTLRPIFDRLSIARAKLAYIVHALAGPLVIAVPLSTWAAAILAQLDNAGISNAAEGKIMADPFYVYINTIPFIFYSLFVMASVVYVVVGRLGFYTVAQEQEMYTVPLQQESDYAEDKNAANSYSLVELLMPLLLLVVTVFVGILYAGGYYVFGGNHSFIDAFRYNNQTFLVLCCAAFGAFGAGLVMQLHKKRIAISAVPGIVREGFVLMKSSIIMVILASILGAFLRSNLYTGDYIASLLLGTIPLSLFPAMLFIVSLIITLTTGSAWGTFSLLIPITVQMLIALLQLSTPVSLDQIALIYPVLGALLSGAACGNHISPFAETTVMTATSTGIEPLYHAKTQFPYAIPVIMGTFFAFVCTGLLSTHSVGVMLAASWLSGLIVCLCLVRISEKIIKNQVK